MNWVAKLGQNIQFVAGAAHFAVAALVVEHVPAYPLHVCLGVIAAAGVKEFWFDAKYETDPPQTFQDNLQDFLGWGLGALAGYFLW